MMMLSCLYYVYVIIVINAQRPLLHNLESDTVERKRKEKHQQLKRKRKVKQQQHQHQQT
jgi:Ca2+/Na+ antiporter